MLKLSLKDGVVTRSAKALSASGVVAAVVIALALNIFSARHYKRWDVTTERLYTLSPATQETLRALEQNIDINVLLSPSDPLEPSVRKLLITYGAESRRLTINYIDPDRHPAEFLATQQKYGMMAAKTDDGRVTMDASVVVSSGQRHWFLTPTDLVDLSDIDEGRASSKLEQSITGAIRAVVSAEQVRVCFSKGHGEAALHDSGDEGLSEFNARLDKNSYYEVREVDSTKPNAKDEYKDCDVLLVVSPRTPFSAEESEQIGRQLQAGMSAVVLLEPVLDTTAKKQQGSGLEPVAKLFGIGISQDFVFELDDSARLARGSGELFYPELRPHPITEGLIAEAGRGFRVILTRARSLSELPGSKPSTLLVTSPQAFGMTNFFGWIERGGQPTKSSSDNLGPLSVAMAAELPQTDPAKKRGSRLVVVGTGSVAINQNWRNQGLRGNVVFIESALSWVSARPPIVDVPPRPTVVAGLRISEESVGEVARYVLLYMPLAASLLGVAVYLRRRSSDRRTLPQTRSKS